MSDASGDIGRSGTLVPETSTAELVSHRDLVLNQSQDSHKSSNAVQRLETSRLKLEAAMLPPVRPVRPARSAKESGAFSAPQFLKEARELPGIGFVVDAAASWWNNHPLRPVAAVLTEVVNVSARPLAARNPIGMVGVASLVGAALAWARPWRWLLRSALLAGFVPQLAARVITKLPIESWLTMLTTALRSKRPEPMVSPPATTPAGLPAAR